MSRGHVGHRPSCCLLGGSPSSLVLPRRTCVAAFRLLVLHLRGLPSLPEFLPGGGGEVCAVCPWGQGRGGFPQTLGHPADGNVLHCGAAFSASLGWTPETDFTFPLPLLVTYFGGIAAHQIEAALLPQAWFWPGERWSPRGRGQEAITLQGWTAFTVLPPVVPEVAGQAASGHSLSKTSDLTGTGA